MDHVESIRKVLPYLRRYTRALLCDQSNGDDLAALALERLIQNPKRITESKDIKTLLFQVFHEVLAKDAAIQNSMVSELSSAERQALLLCGMEEFSIQSASIIMARSESDISALLSSARNNSKLSSGGNVLIIEDELMIALELERILNGLGHQSIGTARTHKEAITLIEENRPELILADIHLADESSGLDAVNEILQRFADIPVVFITAFPEMLLTGVRPEPSFLIAKPYSASNVEATISQAMLFARRSV